MFNGKKHLLITYFQFRRILEGFGIEKECRGPTRLIQNRALG